MDLGLYTKSMELLKRAMDARALRHRVLVSNIANLETPGFVPRAVRFQEELQRQLAPGGRLVRTHPRHLGAGGIGGFAPRIVADPDPNPGNDGNAVNVDREMARLAENTLMYNALAQILARKFRGLKEAIQEAGR